MNLQVSRLQNEYELSASERAAFKRDGYLLVRGLYNAAQMAVISRWVDEIAAWPELPGKYMMYFEQSLSDPSGRLLNRVENFYPYHQGFQDLFNSPGLLGITAELLGAPAVLFKDKINFKMPGGDGFRAHQDVQAGWDRYGSLHMTILLSIDACTVGNGCLELVASHQQRGQVGASWEPLSSGDTSDMLFEPCITQPGDVVFFDSFVPHRSAPNKTDTPRRVLYVTYNRAAEGDSRMRYYSDKRESYPPDCEREADKQYCFRV